MPFIMKLLPLVFSFFIFVSCSYTEELSIDEDGKIDFRYQLYVDEKETDFKSGKNAFQAQHSIPTNELSINELLDVSDGSFNTLSWKTKQNLQLYNEKRAEFSTMDFARFQLDFTTDNFEFTYHHRANNVEEFNANSKELETVLEQIKTDNENGRNRLFEKQLTNYTNFRLEYDGRTFERIATNPLTISQENSREKELDIQNEAEAIGIPITENLLSKISAIVAVKLKYTFPKPIKLTTLSDVEFSDDRKSMTKSITFYDKIMDSTYESFQVTF